MTLLRLLFLFSVLAVTSGYKFRCFIFCSDQTNVQNEYVEQRDTCRDYAQLKLDMAMRDSTGAKDDQARKSMLIQLFGECMSKNGWSVTDSKQDKDKAAAAGQPVTATPASADAAAADWQQDKAFIARSSECTFARHSAGYSANASARAAACDLECEQRLRAAPEAPRPAACPAEAPPKSLSTGSTRD